MTRLEEHLLIEKLNLNYKMGDTYDSLDQYEIEFDVGELEYTFMAERFYLDDSPDMKKYLGLDPDVTTTDMIWDIEFKQDSIPKKPGKGQYDITGEQGAKALQVFSGVATALKRFILAKRPEYFSFSGRETNRVKLYSRFAKMIPKISKKYKLKVLKKNQTIFTFIRT